MEKRFDQQVISIRHIIIILTMACLAMAAPQFSYAQNGANLKAGMVLVGDLNLGSLSDTAMHKKGYHIGVDARIGPYGFFLSPGLHYYAIDIASSTGFNYLNRAPKYHLIKGPLNIGYKIFITRKIKFRIQGGLDINYVLLIDENQNDIDFDNVNDAYFGINLGTGLDINKFTLDLNFESGLTGALKNEKDSQFNFITASLGFFF